VQELANSGVFWGLLIFAVVALYTLPTTIGLIRNVDGLALVILLNLLGWIGWPAALILAFGPRRKPPPLPVTPYQPPIVIYSPQVVILPSGQWPSYGSADVWAPPPLWYPQPPESVPASRPP
jgi:hypothetical protein